MHTKNNYEGKYYFISQKKNNMGKVSMVECANIIKLRLNFITQ